MKTSNKFPEIIQGGMGIGVSNWRLARAVAMQGEMGVVSGTAIDSVFVRRLQLGDPGGDIRRALSYFPWQDMARRVLDAYFIEGGKPDKEPFKLIPMPSVNMPRSSTELTIMANFAEVFLSKEGHNGIVGINYLEKIQLPTLPSIFGAMLGGVDCILMGAGIPLSIPGILDALSELKPVELKLSVEDNTMFQNFFQRFDPIEFVSGNVPELTRPKFLAIVSSDIVAKTLIKKASGSVEGFIVENHTAGGHNAPPRKTNRVHSQSHPQFTEKDIPNVAKIAEFERPFWLGGGYGTPERLKEAIDMKANGVQVGTAFAFCKESAIMHRIKQDVIRKCLDGAIEVLTDFNGSPTGYPFKLVRLEDTAPFLGENMQRRRVCDLGYLRRIYCKSESGFGYRCPAEPIESFIAKGGLADETLGKLCLCNGLMATIGLGQVRNTGIESPIVTSGEDLSVVAHLVGRFGTNYSAEDVINYLKS
jgi:nitronate monooxygenase